MANSAIRAITHAAKHRLLEIRKLSNYEPTMYDVEQVHNHSKEVERFIDILNGEWEMATKYNKDKKEEG